MKLKMIQEIQNIFHKFCANQFCPIYKMDLRTYALKCTHVLRDSRMEQILHYYYLYIIVQVEFSLCYVELF